MTEGWITDPPLAAKSPQSLDANWRDEAEYVGHRRHLFG